MTSDPDEVAVDGFTWAQLHHMLMDGVADAVCEHCEAEHQVEPDARDYTCESCGTEGAVTSPLVKLGLI